MSRCDLIPWLVESGNGLYESLDHLVDDVLIPEGQQDLDAPLPATHLDRLISVGLVSIVTASQELWNSKTRFAVTEKLAFGCLDTWFVMTQHWGAVNILRSSHVAVESFWDQRSLIGVGFGHLRRSSPCLKAELTDSGLFVTGTAPWITGSSWLSWVVYGATLPTGDHVYFRVRHLSADGYSIGKPQELAAVKRTDTREVSLHVTVESDNIVCIRPQNVLSNQDESTLITSMAPILGLTARCLADWEQEVQPDNVAVFKSLTDAFTRLRNDVYNMLAELEAVPVSERLRARENLHTLLETIIHIWSLSSGGQSNTRGMLVIRRRQEASFFRLFQQTKMLRDAAIASAMDRISS